MAKRLPYHVGPCGKGTTCPQCLDIRSNRTKSIRPYVPPLHRGLVELLASCPYDSPRPIHADARHQANTLITYGLLERSPSEDGMVEPRLYRVTDRGAEVVRRWKRSGWLA